MALRKNSSSFLAAPALAAVTALTALTAVIATGCQTRGYNKSPHVSSSASTGTAIARSSNLPPFQDLEEAGDIDRLMTPLPDDFRADFAMCKGYPNSGCKIEAFKAGILGPLTSKLESITEKLSFMTHLPPSTAKDALEQAKKETEAAIAALQPVADATVRSLEAAIAADPSFDVNNPIKYVGYLKAQDREPPRIAAATILKYMRVLRKNIFVFPSTTDVSPKARERRIRFYRFLRNDERPPDPGKTSIKDAKDAEEAQAIADHNWYLAVREKFTGSNDSPLHDADWIADAGDDLRSGTLSAAPPHWNDLQAHYYAATGHRRHGCYTSVHRAMARIVDEADLPELIAGEGPVTWATLRNTAVRFCTSESKEKKGDGHIIHDWAIDEKKVLSAIEAIRLNKSKTVDLVQLDIANFTRVFFRRMWISQIVGNEPGEQAVAGKSNPKTNRPYNVFDYVMLAPTWSQNFDQQQSIINAFYHELSETYGPDGRPLEKPIDGALAPYVPGTLMGCETRPARLLVDNNKSEVCQFDRVRKSSLHDIGR